MNILDVMPDIKTILLVTAFVANLVQLWVIASLNEELDAVKRMKDLWLELYMRTGKELYDLKNKVDE